MTDITEKFPRDSIVRFIDKTASYKYNARPEKERGFINDVYYSKASGEFIYEVDFSYMTNRRGGFELVRQADIELDS